MAKRIIVTVLFVIIIQLLLGTFAQSGTKLDGNLLTGRDLFAQTIQETTAAAISISVDPLSQGILSGESAVFSITIENMGDVALTNVNFTDSLSPGCDQNIGTLDPGTDSTFSCTKTNVTAGFNYVATVSADDDLENTLTANFTASVLVFNPSITITKTLKTAVVVNGEDATFNIEVANTGDVTLDQISVTDVESADCARNYANPLTPESTFSYECVEAGVTGSFDNVAVVAAVGEYGTNVSAQDTASVLIVNPKIAITKTLDTEVVVNGEDASFTIALENTGDVTLNGITVTDAESPNCDKADIGSLAPAATTSYSCTKTNVTEPFDNIAVVTAVGEYGNSVTAQDTASVAIVNPSIAITKTLDTEVVVNGDDASFTIEIENTGDVTLSDIAVTDEASPNCYKPDIGSLTPGSTTSYSCIRENVAETFNNVAVVTAVDQYGHNVTAQDTETVQVINPSIAISKTPDPLIVVTGDSAKFTIRVENTGDVALSSIIITDEKSAVCDYEYEGSLDPASAFSYPCEKTNVIESFENVAVVTAVDGYGHSVFAEDTASVQVIDPDITITKEADNWEIAKGDVAYFTIVVKNTGDVSLKNIVVKDEQVSSCERDFGTEVFAPDQEKTIHCYKTAVLADLINKASVTARDNYGNVVADIDSASVEVQSPDIRIVKGPKTQAILKGGTAKFYVTVVNPSTTVILTDVKVVDPLTPDCNRNFVRLGTGESKSYWCVKESVSEPYTNYIEVSGRNILTNDRVSDTSTADVEILDMQAAMQISPPVQTEPGGAADFTITINNSGSVSFKLQSLIIDLLGSLIDPNNSKLEDNSCLGAGDSEVDPGEIFACSFTADSEMATGVYLYNLTAKAKDEHDLLVTKSTTSSLIVADTNLLRVTLEAKPDKLPAPETTAKVEEWLTITNLSTTSTLTLDTLVHSELGNLNHVGTCSLPQIIPPEDSYPCIFGVKVSGETGDVIHHEVSAAGLTTDDLTAGNIAETSIYFINEDNLMSWLPVVLQPSPYEEENDGKCQAFLIKTNVNYTFTLDDPVDWFKFNVERSGQAQLLINHLISTNSQVTLFDQEDCTKITDADRIAYNGDVTPDKLLKFSAESGTYFLRVLNYDTGAVNSTYSLSVKSP